MNLLIHVAGWSLLHFVWQGTLIGLAAAAALRIVPRTFPRVRYAAASLALAAMLATVEITAVMVSSSASAIPLRDASSIDLLTDGAAAPVVPASAANTQQTDFVTTALRVPNATLLTTVVALWLAGVLLCFGRLLGGWWRVRRLHRAALSMSQSNWQLAAARLAASLGLRRNVQIVDSELVDTPTLIGWLRPVILLPIAALANLTPSQVEAILAHELAHVRRHDYLVNLLQTVAETLLFYHPAVWWVSRQIRTEREHCCDEVAVTTCGNAVDYAAALEQLERSRGRDVGFAIAATAGPLLERVRRVLQVPADDQRPAANLGVLMALVVLIIVVSGGLQHLPASPGDPRTAERARQVPPPPPPPPPPPEGALAGWKTAETASFEILYSPDLESEVERVGREAEAAYAQLKADLRHELAFKPRLVIFATRRDMERALAANTIPGSVQQLFEGHLVLTLPLDTSPARLRGDLVHEITHVFGYDILPASRRGDVPEWIHEGLAEHERGEWDASDAALVADLIRRGAVPRISAVGIEGIPGNPRLNQILGHAAFDFIVSRAGKNGLRRFLFAVRQAPVGGLASTYATTFGITPDDFDRSFEEYLRARFTARR